MRRWLVAASAILAVVALALALLPPPAPVPARASQTAAVGLVLLEEDEGLYVLGVMDGSSAGRAGIQPGDRLALSTVAQLEALLADQDAPLPLTLLRQDQTVTVHLPPP